MSSVISIEKKKNPIPPAIIAIHEITCLILDITRRIIQTYY
jgi:hypothetical protein